MTSLFVSYSRKDSDFAHKLIDAFTGQDWEFWIDWEDIPPTVDWWQEIEKGIEESGVFLFLLSPESVRSKYCWQEIEHAAKNGKRLIPIVVRDVNVEQVPSELCKLNWIFIRENDDFQAACEKLFLAVRTDYDWVKAHRQLQFKALEWEKGNHDKSFLLRGTELQFAEFQLKTNSSKDPHPTDLQRDYVLKSRQAADKQRRTVIGIGIGVVAALAVLAIIAMVQAVSATNSEHNAQTQEVIAQEQAATAKSAQAAAVSAKSTAVANEQIARARELSARSLEILDRDPELSLLLAVAACDITYQKQKSCLTEAEIALDKALQSPFAGTFRGHSGLVNSVSFNPDGSHIVTAGWDSTARIWDLSQRKELAFLEASPAPDMLVSTGIFSPDGGRILTTSFDGTVRLWNAKDRNLIADLLGHTGAVQSAEFSANGSLIVTASSDRTARVWDGMTGALKLVLTGHSDQVWSASFSPDSTKIITTSEDGTARLWSTQDGTLLKVFSEDNRKQRVIIGVFSPDGRKIATASGNSAFIWNVDDGALLTSLEGHKETITSIVFHQKNTQLVTASVDDTARIWDVEHGLLIATLTGHTGDINSVQYNPDGSRILTASRDGTACIWDSQSGELIFTLKGNAGSVRDAQFKPPDGNVIVTASADGTAKIWLLSANSKRLLRF